MASSKAMASSTVLLLSLNLVFFTMVTSSYVPCPPPPCPPTSSGGGGPSTPPTTPPPPTSSGGGGPSTPPTTPVPSTGNCPIDALKLGVCADVLNLVHVVIGTPPKVPCCTLIQGLADLEAAVCLCTALKANILGLNLNLPISLSLVLNYCGKGTPAGFQCA